MRAIVAHAAKDIRIEETPTPALAPQDVRVRIATSETVAPRDLLRCLETA